MTNKVYIEGEFVSKSGKKRTRESFSEEFVLSNMMSELPRIRKFVQNYLAPKILKKKHEGFCGLISCNVLNVVPTSDPSVMGTLDELILQAIEMNCLPHNLDLITKNKHKASLIKRCIENKRNK
jgi:hypothetical protein